MSLRTLLEAAIPADCACRQLGVQVLLTHEGELVAAAQPGTPLRWVGYLSSTGATGAQRACSLAQGSCASLAIDAGVYGDHGGARVDETSQLRVTPAAGKPWLRAQAEAAWLRLHAVHGVPVHVFRLGGIYGTLL